MTYIFLLLPESSPLPYRILTRNVVTRFHLYMSCTRRLVPYCMLVHSRRGFRD